MALNTLDPEHRPDYTNTEPPFEIAPQPAWFQPGKIVSLDPWGHLVQVVFKEVSTKIELEPTSVHTFGFRH